MQSNTIRTLELASAATFTVIPSPAPPLQLFSLAGTVQSETLYPHTPRERWKERTRRTPHEQTGGDKKKGFSLTLKGICPQRARFSPVAEQTAPRPYGGFERCTACEHYPPVKDKVTVSKWAMTTGI